MNQTTARIVALALLTALPAMAQESARPISLGVATGALGHEFIKIGSVRELSDGRVLVTDPNDDAIIVGDFSADSSRAIRALGSGPGEYRDLGMLIPLGGDTTLMADASNRRFLILYRDRILSTLAPDDPLVSALGTNLIGADASSRLVGIRVFASADVTKERRRNGRAIVSIDRRSLNVDTIARIRDTELSFQAVGPPDQGMFRTATVIMSSPEQAAVFADGQVAIALQEPYRVEWHGPDGRVLRGAPIERIAPPVDDAEREAWKKRYEALSGEPWTFPDDRFPWAEFVPPISQGALTALPDGNLLVAREPWSGGPGHNYDVIDRRGIRSGTLQLGASGRVVGAGRGVIYVASIDVDGIEHLQRHAWP